MSEYLKQINWVEAGKQIGYTSINNNICIQTAIQKVNGTYKVFYSVWDMKYQYDDFEEENEEVKNFTTIEDAVFFIESKNIMFSQLAPLKGNKIFNPAFYP